MPQETWKTEISKRLDSLPVDERVDWLRRFDAMPADQREKFKQGVVQSMATEALAPEQPTLQVPQAFRGVPLEEGSFLGPRTGIMEQLEKIRQAGVATKAVAEPFISPGARGTVGSILDAATLGHARQLGIDPRRGEEQPTAERIAERVGELPVFIGEVGLLQAAGVPTPIAWGLVNSATTPGGVKERGIAGAIGVGMAFWLGALNKLIPKIPIDKKVVREVVGRLTGGAGFEAPAVAMGERDPAEILYGLGLGAAFTRPGRRLPAKSLKEAPKLAPERPLVEQPRPEPTPTPREIAPEPVVKPVTLAEKRIKAPVAGEFKKGDPIEMTQLYADLPTGRKGTLEKVWVNPKSGVQWGRVFLGRNKTGQKLAKSIPLNVVKLAKPLAPKLLPPKAEPMVKRGVDKYLSEKINYGGEMVSRGSVMTDLQKKGYTQKQIDAYMMGAKPRPKGFIDVSKAKEPKYEGEAKEVWQMYKGAIKSSRDIKRPTFHKAITSLKRKVVDVSGNYKTALRKGGKEARDVVRDHELSAGATAHATREYDKTAKKIFGGLSKVEEDHLAAYVTSRRTIAIEGYKKGVKHPGGKGTKELKQFIEAIPKDIKDKIVPRTKAYFAEFDKIVDSYYKNGLVDEAGRNALKQHVYSPRRFLHHIDPDKDYTFGGRKITVPSSGIKKLDVGSEQQLEMDLPKLLKESMIRAETRIARNTANQSAYKFAKDSPDNKVFLVAPVEKTTKAGKVIYKKAPGGYETISVMIDGKPKNMWMPWDMAKEWVKNDPHINAQLANWIGWVSGAKIVRFMATGGNPEFALRNFPRDAIHLWLTTGRVGKDVYSKHFPKFFAEFNKDIKEVTSDGIMRKGLFDVYAKHGGLMGFLTHQGAITKKAKGIVGGFQTGAGYIGETSEIIPRLAIMNRFIKNAGYNPKEIDKVPVDVIKDGVWEARSYLDFFQGGSYVKALDTGFPYLNAGVQAVRTAMRAARDNPVVFTYKIAQLGTIATGLYFANQMNKECWDQVSDYDKANYFIITSPFYRTDQNGNKRYLYMRIAKDNLVRPFTALFEGAAAKTIGEDVNVDQMVEAAQNVFRVAPLENLPPSASAYWGYQLNKNIWRKTDMWRYDPKIKPSEQIDPYTHPAFERVGVIGLSPKKTQEALKAIFTQGNIWTSLTGWSWKALFNEMSEADRERVTKEMIYRKPGIRRIFKETYPSNKYRKGLEEVETEFATERYKITREFDKLSRDVLAGRGKNIDIKRFIGKAPKGEQDRLIRRFLRRKKMKDVPNKSMWLDLAAISQPEARATAFWLMWREADKKKRVELLKTAQSVPGMMSDRFIGEFNNLRKKEAKK